MTPEEKAVIRAAQRWAVRDSLERVTDLRVAVQRLAVSRQPEHTVEPIPCGVYANNSATMFCILPKGHEGGEPENERFPVTRHVGYPGGVRGTGPNGGARAFDHWPHYESMETHERPACARFPGCERHP